MKREKGFILTGLLLIAAALLLTGYNLWRDRHAETVSKDALEELLLQIQENSSAANAAALPTSTPAPQRAESQEDPETNETLEGGQAEVEEAQTEPEAEAPEVQTLTLTTGSYIGVLSIPAISRELPILSEVSSANLQSAPCRYIGSANNDDLIICAHNYTSHFGNLKNLQEGDEVIFTDIAGNEYRYAVAEIEILQPTDIYKMVFKESDLTLFTCTLGGKTRVTVRCKRADA